jgi:hypothetical protein
MKTLLLGLSLLFCSAVAMAAPAPTTFPPGGSNTQLQYNDSGRFRGISVATFSKTDNHLYLSSAVTFVNVGEQVFTNASSMTFTNVRIDLAGSSEIAFANGDILTESSVIFSAGSVFDGGGDEIVVNSTSTPIVIPYDCVITTWTVVGSTGTIQIDVLRSSYASFTGTDASIVGGGTKPNMTANVKGQSAPTSWTATTLAAYDVIRFAVTSVSGVTQASIVLTLRKT